MNESIPSVIPPALSTSTIGPRAGSRTGSRGLPQTSTRLDAPSENFDDLLSKHKKFVKQALSECQRVEEKRAQRFERAQTASERAQLEKRFEMERSMDKEKLGRLTRDFELVKQAIARGELAPSIVEARKQLSKGKVLPKLDVDHNRFAGCETQADIVKYEGVINMFNKCDRAFNSKRAPKFDPYPIQKSLQLLKQKKEILTQLVNVQHRELAERSAATYVKSTPSGFKNHPMNSSRSGYAASVCSDASSSSRASWATFGSRGGGAAYQPPRPPNRVIVPPLKLGGAK